MTKKIEESKEFKSAVERSRLPVGAVRHWLELEMAYEEIPFLIDSGLSPINMDNCEEPCVKSFVILRFKPICSGEHKLKLDLHVVSGCSEITLKTTSLTVIAKLMRSREYCLRHSMFDDIAGNVVMMHLTCQVLKTEQIEVTSFNSARSRMYVTNVNGTRDVNRILTYKTVEAVRKRKLELQRIEQCKTCKWFCGDYSMKRLTVCGMHPYGPKSEHCADRTPIDYT